MSTPMPDAVMALLRDHAGTFEHLQVLLLLHEDRERRWQTEEVAAQLRLESDHVSKILGDLVKGRIVSRDVRAGRPVHGYAPEDISLEGSVSWLARDRKEGGLLTIRTLSNLAIERVRTSALRTFSDAFILRKRPLG